MSGAVSRTVEVAAADDRTLCARLRASDVGALRDIFNQLRDDLVRYVSTIVRDTDLAHDLIQDVFISLWDLRRRIDPDCALRSYIYRMARNRAYRHLRDERLHAAKHEQIAREAVAQPLLAPAPDEDVDRAIIDGHVQRWLDALPDRQREALALSRFQGLSHREIAAIMGISARTVNNHILRALANLENSMRSLEIQRTP